MKKISVGLLAIVFMACKNGPTNAEKAAAAKQKVDTAMQAVKHAGIDIGGLAIQTKDPYCNMPVTAGITDTATVDGKLYGFCAKACKDEFFRELAAKK